MKNRYFCGHFFINKMNRALADRIEANRIEYHRLLEDSNYTDVRFDDKTGGLLAIHRCHYFDPTVGIFGIPRGEYEKIASDTLYDYGMSVILKSEISGYLIKTPEGLLNGKLFDIKSIEGTGKNNIINNMKGASKKKVEAVVLYYHDKNMFSEKQLREGYQFYLRNSQSKHIQNVYYIVDGKLYLL
jgi:hypothetical protein